MKNTTRALALLAAAATASCGFIDRIGTTRAYNYGVITHSSAQIGADEDFTENNPGFGIGSEAPIRNSNLAIGLEVGRYRDAVNNRSTYALTYMEQPIFANNPRRLRIGAFGGFVEMPDDANRLDDRLPTIGDMVLVGGLQATIATFGAHEFRMRIAPGLRSSEATFIVQSNFKF
jgi:hypothetical protein